MKTLSFSSVTSWWSGRKSGRGLAPHEQGARIQAAQLTALQMLSSREPLEKVLEALVRSVEEHCEGTIGSVLLLDDQGHLHVGAAPGLPDEYNRLSENFEIGPSRASCGTAAHRGERVVVENIAEDPLWADFKESALQFGLRAGWSQPIFSADGKVLGTFAMYYREPRRPAPADEEYIEVAAQLASIAIESRRGEQALRNSETRLRQIVDLVPQMIFAKDRDGRFLLANRKVADAYGTSAEDLIGKKHEDIHPGPNEVAEMLADDRKVIDGQQREFIPEENFTDSQGKLRVLQTTKIPYRQPGSNEPAVLGIAIDITERTREREDQRASARRVLRQTAVLIELAKCEQLCSSDFGVFARLATETAAHTLGVERVSVWLFDNDRTVLRCEDLYEMSKNWHSSGTELEAATFPHYFAALERGRRVTAHDARRHPDTSEFNESYLEPLGITSMLDAPLRLGDELLGVVCQEHVGPKRDWAPDEQDFASTVADLVSLALEASKRVRAEQAFRSAQEELLRQQWNARQQVEDELEAVKDDLVCQTRHATIGQIAASVAHELRSPLAAIREAGESMKDQTPATAVCTEYLAAVDTHIAAAVGIIDNLTEMSQAHEPEKTVVDLSRAIENSLTWVPETAGMRVSKDLSPEPFHVEADPEMLGTVLMNLIANSARATDGIGEIEFAARRQDGFDVITVRDDGPGVPAEIRERVFEPLCTGEDGGAGLGLTLSRQIVERHGGSLELVESQGNGAVFRITLPGPAQ